MGLHSGLAYAALMAVAASAHAQPLDNGLLKVGGFRCVDLKALRNDSTIDLYEIGYWTSSGFRMEVWKRNGVPFWYPQGTGDVRVAGPLWKPVGPDIVSTPRQGAVAEADSQQPGNGAIAFANDSDLTTYWYAGDGHPAGSLWISFAHPARVRLIRFLGWATPRHALRDYSVGLLLADGSRREVAAVQRETRMGQWIEFPVEPTEAQGIYLDVRSTGEGEHGPVIYEFQAMGEPAPGAGLAACPAEVVIPLAGTPAEELFCLGHVGSGFDSAPGVLTPVGEYVLHYVHGEVETVPLVAGRNIADLRYGSFVPKAEFAFGLRDPEAEASAEPGARYYHLDEMLPVEPKLQVQMYGHRLAHPGQPLQALTFRCTDPRASLLLAAVTLRRQGPRLNALVYNGRRVRPYPKGTPQAPPSPLERLRDQSRLLSLDGDWRYMTDPGNQGVRHRYFAPEHDLSDWPRMPVPSQWYVEGLDYHGVVWFGRDLALPASFPGSVLELRFGGVDYDARVWVNGVYVGRHVGAYSAFTLDATAALRRGARNTITVRVDSPVDPGVRSRKTLIKGNSMDDIAMPYNQEGCMGGIFRPVVLVGRGDVGIEDPWTECQLSPDLTRARVTVRCDLLPSAAVPRTVSVVCRLTEPPPESGRPRTFRAGRTVALEGRSSISLVLDIENPRLWYPWEQGKPELHLLEIEVRRGRELLDRHVSRVGIREVSFEASENCLYVNHHRVFIKGMLNDDVHWMSLMDRTGHRQRIELQRRANLNLIRMVGHQSSPDMYDLCDELGMMIWQEMPLQWQYSTTAPIRDDILRVVTETVTQCRPHASVVGWSAWNEGGQGEFSDRLVALMRSLDPTRPLTRASGGGDFDVHIYPNLSSNLPRRSFFWSGIKLGFVSEVGAYGLPSVREMREVLGRELFPFDSAEYFWETFNSYRYVDGPVFSDAPTAADWPTAEIRGYVLSHAERSERWLSQFMKFMYEDFRAQRFEPTTAAVHCRFDDPLPTAFLGVVSFNGTPRQAYWAVQQACRQVLPILSFDCTGVEALRVVNEYWHRGWEGCRLSYTFRTHDGTPLRQGAKTFDLPPDSTVQVLTREDVGDLFAVPGGFVADLAVRDQDGRVLSRNRYDLTQEEVRLFVESVYPTPPATPYDSIVLPASEAAEVSGLSRRLPGEGAYSPVLFELGGQGQQPYLRFVARTARAGEYLVRASCDSGDALRRCELQVDGKPATLESYPYVDMAAGITRAPYSAHSLSWRPGWAAQLAAGEHSLEFRWPQSLPAPVWVLDAVSLQYRPPTPTSGPADHREGDPGT